MFRTTLTGLDRKRLRLWLAVFFLALLVPTSVLIWHAYSQLKWEAFHQHRLQAEELAKRIDRRFVRLIDQEGARSFADYSFLVVVGDPAANFVQRSPLSVYPATFAIPGLIGYFQVDAQGTFTPPLLPERGAAPDAYGIPAEELSARLALQRRIQTILNENRLATAGEAGRPPSGRLAVELLAGPCLAPAAEDGRGIGRAGTPGKRTPRRYGACRGTGAGSGRLRPTQRVIRAA